jgi:Zn-dependent M28 family amino/carboxypeptidase
MPCTARRFAVCLLVATLLAGGFTGCKRKRPYLTKFAAPERPVEIWKEFSGENALRNVDAIVSHGPRPSGSPELEQCRQYIITALKGFGWETERQAFTASTPRGSVEFVNLVARFAGATKGSQEVLLCSHYDTKLFDTIRFVGANDAGSSTGALIEMARVLAMDPALAWRVELVFFDGEEAVQQFTKTDGLYGSRHFAKKLVETGRALSIKYGIVWDMIGEKDLTITLPPDSPSELARAILAGADALGVRRHFSYHSMNVMDDHTPLNEAGVPTIDLIDFDFDPWHTADDTMDKLSAESLRTVGAVTLWVLRRSYPK